MDKQTSSLFLVTLATAIRHPVTTVVAHAAIFIQKPNPDANGLGTEFRQIIGLHSCGMSSILFVVMKKRLAWLPGTGCPIPVGFGACRNGRGLYGVQMK